MIRLPVQREEEKEEVRTLKELKGICIIERQFGEADRGSREVRKQGIRRCVLEVKEKRGMKTMKSSVLFFQIPVVF